jgi:Ca2+-transporting ATPase
VQDNLRRAIRFQIAGNLGELMYVVGGALVGRRLVSPLGVLWINLLTDTLPGLALSLEAGDPRVLDRAPAPPGAPILDRADWRRVARDGAAIAGGAAAAAIAAGPLAGFAVIGAGQFGYAAACRAPERAPEGPRFALLVGGSAALHLAAVATQPMRSLLRMGGPSPVAIGAFAIALAAPLYLAWRKRAGRLVTRGAPIARRSAARHGSPTPYAEGPPQAGIRRNPEST